MSKKYGDAHEQYMTREEMDELCDNRLLCYFRAVKDIYWAGREVHDDPTCLERSREAKIIARELLIQRGVMEKENDS